ncbi:MAG: 4-hydroxy-tetrahydrodipicolinate synthase [Flavobacteriales bacterium Tduv]
MTNKVKKLYGTGVALVTPFDKNKKIDYKALEKLIAHVSQGKVEYMVVLGSTGEPATLNKEEKEEIIRCIKNTNKNNLPLILTIGGNYTEKVIKQIRQTDLTDFEAILSVSPYYNRPTQEGIYRHFKALAENTEANIILYNVPTRTGSNMLPDTVIRLAHEFKNIIGIKEASGNILQAYEILRQKPENFSVISGDDALALPITLGGGDSVISVVAQGIPEEFSEMIRLAHQKKLKEAFYLYYKIFEITQLAFEEGNPTGIKALLSTIGICKPYVRLPLVEATEQLQQKIRSTYETQLAPIAPTTLC